jgi:hypothetical protein
MQEDSGAITPGLQGKSTSYEISELSEQAWDISAREARGVASCVRRLGNRRRFGTGPCTIDAHYLAAHLARDREAAAVVVDLAAARAALQVRQFVAVTGTLA